MKTFRTALAFLIIALMVAACSKVTQENFAKVQDGMTEAEVNAILGPPTESQSVQALGVSGTSSRWVSGDTQISIRFLGGKVALKSFDKPGTGKSGGK
jgi:hypothetical protein